MPTLKQVLVASLLRRYPFFSGCGTVANHKITQRLAGLSTEQVWTSVPGGKIIIDFLLAQSLGAKMRAMSGAAGASLAARVACMVHAINVMRVWTSNMMLDAMNRGYFAAADAMAAGNRLMSSVAGGGAKEIRMFGQFLSEAGVAVKDGALALYTLGAHNQPQIVDGIGVIAGDGRIPDTIDGQVGYIIFEGYQYVMKERVDETVKDNFGRVVENYGQE
jgi:hypothetical protein